MKCYVFTLQRSFRSLKESSVYNFQNILEPIPSEIDRYIKHFIDWFRCTSNYHINVALKYRSLKLDLILNDK